MTLTGMKHSNPDGAFTYDVAVVRSADTIDYVRVAANSAIQASDMVAASGYVLATVADLGMPPLFI